MDNSCRKLLSGSSRFLQRRLRPEEEGEEDEDANRHGGWHQPDRRPVVTAAITTDAGIHVHDPASNEGADEHAGAIRDERDESLRRRADVQRCLLIDVDLSADEEEVVADAVDQKT